MGFGSDPENLLQYAWACVSYEPEGEWSWLKAYRLARVSICRTNTLKQRAGACSYQDKDAHVIHYAIGGLPVWPGAEAQDGVPQSSRPMSGFSPMTVEAQMVKRSKRYERAHGQVDLPFRPQLATQITIHWRFMFTRHAAHCTCSKPNLVGCGKHDWHAG